ncbi:Uncharacterized protein ChrSV_0773 [Chromobacterium vaccinii]|nr:Uncharacterized protein ChrSW_0773 [Chromobacterium vaccinii]QND88232.1 Uncharacterized protein ChrSV_0773 [Chromobacterium vaccinii]
MKVCYAVNYIQFHPVLLNLVNINQSKNYTQSVHSKTRLTPCQNGNDHLFLLMADLEKPRNSTPYIFTSIWFNPFNTVCITWL